jgi:hypothetical protein
MYPLKTAALLASLTSLLLLPACGMFEAPTPAPVLVKRKPDATLLQPCDLPIGSPPARPDGKQAALLWLEAEELLYRCAAKHDATVDFILEREPRPHSPAPPAELRPAT